MYLKSVFLLILVTGGCIREMIFVQPFITIFATTFSLILIIFLLSLSITLIFVPVDNSLYKNMVVKQIDVQITLLHIQLGAKLD